MLVIRRSIIYANKFIPISIVDSQSWVTFVGGANPLFTIYVYIYIYIYIYMVIIGFAPPTIVTHDWESTIEIEINSFAYFIDLRITSIIMCNCEFRESLLLKMNLNEVLCQRVVLSTRSNTIWPSTRLGRDGDMCSYSWACVSQIRIMDIDLFYKDIG